MIKQFFCRYKLKSTFLFKKMIHFLNFHLKKIAKLQFDSKTNLFLENFFSEYFFTVAESKLHSQQTA